MTTNASQRERILGSLDLQMGRQSCGWKTASIPRSKTCGRR